MDKYVNKLIKMWIDSLQLDDKQQVLILNYPIIHKKEPKYIKMLINIIEIHTKYNYKIINIHYPLKISKHLKLNY